MTSLVVKCLLLVAELIAEAQQYHSATSYFDEFAGGQMAVWLEDPWLGAILNGDQKLRVKPGLPIVVRAFRGQLDEIIEAESYGKIREHGEVVSAFIVQDGIPEDGRDWPASSAELLLVCKKGRQYKLVKLSRANDDGYTNPEPVPLKAFEFLPTVNGGCFLLVFREEWGIGERIFVSRKMSSRQPNVQPSAITNWRLLDDPDSHIWRYHELLSAALGSDLRNKPTLGSSLIITRKALAPETRLSGSREDSPRADKMVFSLEVTALEKEAARYLLVVYQGQDDAELLKTYIWNARVKDWELARGPLEGLRVLVITNNQGGSFLFIGKPAPQELGRYNWDVYERIANIPAKKK